MTQIATLHIDVVPPLAGVEVEVVGDGVVAVRGRVLATDTAPEVVSPLRLVAVADDGSLSVTWAELWEEVPAT